MYLMTPPIPSYGELYDDRIIDELKWVLKEAVVAYSRCLRMAGVPAEIRNGHLQNRSLAARSAESLSMSRRVMSLYVAL